ncbi:MAG: hypothetical protein Q8J69_00330 [Sphingobacteriaceae bacterium]|nr:hypothetical protein [Sphingobacteriaceae bacterium]
MKKARTAQRTGALGVFFNRAVSDGRAQRVNPDEVSSGGKKQDRAADWSFGVITYCLVVLVGQIRLMRKVKRMAIFKGFHQLSKNFKITLFWVLWVEVKFS